MDSPSSHLTDPAATPGKLALIIGPSGVGKSVILQRLRSDHPELHFPKSATTRARRPGEGDDLYYFLTDEEFDRWHAEDKFLEWAKVHSGARYATVRDEIIPPIEQGKTVVREVDVQGFDFINQHPLFSGSTPPYRLISIFILPESKEQLIAQIEKRAPMEQDELKRRLKSMEIELSYAARCTTQVINHPGGIDDTYKRIEDLIFS
jgi:guanylate kinase